MMPSAETLLALAAVGPSFSPAAAHDWMPSPAVLATLRGTQPWTPGRMAPVPFPGAAPHSTMPAMPMPRTFAGPGFLQPLLSEGAALRKVDDGIFSALPSDDEGAPYDTKAALYDHMVGSSLYTRIAWGNKPSDYTAFAQRAHDSNPSGPLLDVGCGSLNFTAEVYANSERPVVLVDRSVNMLRRARQRMIEQSGAVPKNVVFLQADVYDLPFDPGSFDTVAAHGLIHLFDEAPPVADALQRCVAPGGGLYVTSLVHADRAVGDTYLDLANRAGEVGRPKTPAQVKAAIESATGVAADQRLVGNMAFMLTTVGAKDDDAG